MGTVYQNLTLSAKQITIAALPIMMILKMRLTQFAKISLLCILLGACAVMSQAPLNQNLSWTQRQAQLKSIAHWTIHGSLALATTQKAFNASVVWQQTAMNRYTLHLFGPLGLGAVNVSRDAKGVTIVTSEKQPIHGQNTESLLQQELGWSLPIHNFYYWVRGLPAPGSHATKHFDQYHHLSSLSTRQWRVDYLSYMNVNGVDLPHKIRFTSPFTRAVLVISDWKL
ncbi:MAG: outer membrane lipoprotein LolB [Gammaproteobacteria bacterium CG11_big_fil_rev_8_21_14_0_20_46_22]|nr:MAG: outer membrane lipoprotein LolB [Gammaproteobacteria bacterium CG12_big_fil_rev_8_21_14_0_65_46_12]PIR11281.1 MAG: outer membrane lipoprotein LolB [Gammaproteobacteria bacterium CG11_big_fil_rev_8_21_14_0_20_46_22]